MAVAATSLITVAQFKAYLPDLTQTTWDTMLEAIIDGVSVEFDRYTERALAKTAYSSLYLDGNGKQILILPDAPVVSPVSSLKENGVTLTEGLTKDYLLYADIGMIKKPSSGYWAEGLKTILISYTAGYVVQGASPGAGETALPADIKLACFQQVAYEWKRAKGSEWGETGRAYPSGSVSRIETGLLDSVKAILDGYTRRRL